jgi:cytochrome c oxidase subunit 2
MRSRSEQPNVAPLIIIATAASTGQGCAGIQSALDPAGPQSERISHLWWLMFGGCSVVYLIVMGALAVALWRQRQRDLSPDGHLVIDEGSERRMTKAVALALAATTVILFGFMISDYVTGRALTSLHSSDAVTIKVTGHQWWWDFEYDDPSPSQRVRTANEIHIPIGRPVQLQMTSGDVIHSLWVPNLYGKTDLLTGHQTVMWFQADRPGVYRGQCAEYCGHQHAHMAFVVVAEDAGRFNDWLEDQRRPAPSPAGVEQQRGQQVFLTRSCVMCHQIRGTDAGARVGPDLTHLAARRTIAAGTLRNNRANLGDWVTDPQRTKPGNRMPANELSGEDLNALLSYLESLK